MKNKKTIKSIINFGLALAVILTVALIPAAAPKINAEYNGSPKISAGSDYTAAIKADGSLWTWGRNDFGQLGDGTTESRAAPVKIMDDIIFVFAGTSHAMAIKTDGSLWGWGENQYGQLGDGTTENRLTPVKIMDDVKLP